MTVTKCKTNVTKEIKYASNKQIEESYFKALEDPEIPEIFKPQPRKTDCR